MSARKFIVASAVALSFAPLSAMAAGCTKAQLENVRAELKKHVPATPVDELRCGPVNGLYTVLSGKNVLYTVDGKQLIIGGIYDLVNRKDLTQPDRVRVGAASADAEDERAFANQRRVNTALLPQAAFKIGKPGGTKIFMFSDPNCGFCTRAHMGLDAAVEAGANIEVHVIPVAMLRSEAKVRSVLCAPDPAKAMKAAISAAEVQAPAGDCGIEQMNTNLAAMKKMGLGGTPTFVRADGAIMAGWMGQEQFLTWASAAIK